MGGNLYLTTFNFFLTDQVWGHSAQGGRSMDEYSLGFGNPQTGRLAATNPDLSTKDLPSVTYLTSWDSIMMWFKKQIINRLQSCPIFFLPLSWLICIIFLYNWFRCHDENWHHSEEVHSFKSTRWEIFWLHDFQGIHPLDFSSWENEWNDAALPPFTRFGPNFPSGRFGLAFTEHLKSPHFKYWGWQTCDLSPAPTAPLAYFFSSWLTFFHRERKRDHSEHAMSCHPNK